MSEEAYMTQREVNRTEVFIKVSQKKISQVTAAQLLGLSIRQTQRLYSIYKSKGLSGLRSKKRGKTSNHKLSKLTKARVMELITCELYSGFGPTFMTEKLAKYHQIKISRETIRQLMIEAGVWIPKNKKRPVIHQQRQRRARYGELLQIDGSPHAWFEERGESCALLVFIDDATGQTYGKFFESETTAAYMITIREYIQKYGKPQALYSDRHGIFRINKPGSIKKESLTQFGRALKELEIELLWANSPQAKGRVERANKTLQDRLVKEMRLAGIRDIERANEFLEGGFWESYNQKFAINPRIEGDVHRKCKNWDLENILCEKYYRKISKNMELQFENIIYQITEPRIELIRAQVTVLKRLDGKILIEYKGKSVPFREYDKQIKGGEDVDSKQITYIFKEATKIKPSWNHPWKRRPSRRAKEAILQSLRTEEEQG